MTLKQLRENVAFYFACLALAVSLSMAVSHLDGCVKPTPKPPQPQKLIVSIVEESAERTHEQADVLQDASFVEYVKKHKLQIIDDDVVDADGKSPAQFRLVLDAAKGKPLPQVVLQSSGSGEVLSVSPLPLSAAELLVLLKKYGGE